MFESESVVSESEDRRKELEHLGGALNLRLIQQTWAQFTCRVTLTMLGEYSNNGLHVFVHKKVLKCKTISFMG